MTDELTCTQIGRWSLVRYLGHGKSAIVFEGSDGTRRSAVKVFDPELVERFGTAVQQARIAREMSLGTHTHPHLVQIFDGGRCESTQYLFVAMELLEMPNLAAVLQHVPPERAHTLIHQVSSAARFLEDRGLAHRDIKPENIAVDPNFGRAVLLDLGVLRPIGLGDLTDEADQRPFIGTLRYSAPEYLFRREDDTVEGWRALTFYQLGAVIHDILMKKPLFLEYSEPYARLVEAVRDVYPTIAAPNAPPEVVRLAHNCLVKDPVVRLKLVAWEHFNPSNTEAGLGDARARVLARQASRNRAAANPGSWEQEQRQREIQRAIHEMTSKVSAITRHELITGGVFPPHTLETADDISNSAALVRFSLPASADHGLRWILRYQFRLQLLDRLSSAFELRCGAALLLSNQYDTILNIPEITIFSGVPDEDAIRTSIQQVLYKALDRAQRVSEEPSLDFSSLDGVLSLMES